MKNETKLQVVNTPELTAIGYNPQRLTAVVVFKATGGMWEFTRVPSDLGTRFLQAANPERFIQTMFMKRFHVRRLSEPFKKRPSTKPTPAPVVPVPVAPAVRSRTPLVPPLPERKGCVAGVKAAKAATIAHEPVMPGKWALTRSELEQVKDTLLAAELIGEMPAAWLTGLTHTQLEWLRLHAGNVVQAKVRWLREFVDVSGFYRYGTVGD